MRSVIVNAHSLRRAAKSEKLAAAEYGRAGPKPYEKQIAHPASHYGLGK
jgi:hypothetical protein